MQKEKRSSPTEPRPEDLEALVNLANNGHPKALRLLQTFLDKRPQIWQEIGDLSKNAELAMVRLISGKNALLRESVQRSLKALRRDICPPNPTPLEKLLVERVVITWMRVQYIETNYVSAADLSLQEKKFVLQQRESAQRLFDAAVKALGTVTAKLGRLPAPTHSPSPASSQSPGVKVKIFRSTG